LFVAKTKKHGKTPFGFARSFSSAKTPTTDNAPGRRGCQIKDVKDVIGCNNRGGRLRNVGNTSVNSRERMIDGTSYGAKNREVVATFKIRSVGCASSAYLV
jgi:hypothetical protein